MFSTFNRAEGKICTCGRPAVGFGFQCAPCYRQGQADQAAAAQARRRAARQADRRRVGTLGDMLADMRAARGERRS